MNNESTNVSAPPYCSQTSRRLLSARNEFLSSLYAFSEPEQKSTRCILRFHDFAGCPRYPQNGLRQCWQSVRAHTCPRTFEDVSCRLLALCSCFCQCFENFCHRATYWPTGSTRTQQNNYDYSFLLMIQYEARRGLHFAS